MDVDSNLHIINSLFGEPGKVPVRDPRCFDNIPPWFWVNIQKNVERYEIEKFIPGLFNRFYEIVCFNFDMCKEDIISLFLQPPKLTVTSKIGKIKVYSYRKCLYFAEALVLVKYDSRLPETKEVAHLKSWSFNIMRMIETQDFNDQFVRFVDSFFSIIKAHPIYFTDVYKWMTKVLTDFLISRKYERTVKATEKKERDLFSNYKRQVVRDEYLKYDSRISVEFFNENPAEIEPPKLMLDRVMVSVHSKKFMSYSRDVKTVIETSTMESDILTEKMMLMKQKMIEDNYSSIEVQNAMPDDLDSKFSFMENRSILAGFPLSGVPVKRKDGDGYAYWWKTDGVTYRLRYDPPAGAPISLFMIVNVQRIAHKMLAQICPEYEIAYKEEFLEESNFIPTTYVD
ncbi:hypothetical protein [Methanolapillus millepedarum]|uniref:Uncharacterized protein n=1 Tax=Methanolapillus millepedarum TaxID=3028296 RepID=A0AA96V3P1_9EURY|nr:hypothetical protein MsAc7_07080 [Methanosarcinaceae archaeon Ac7]